MDAEEKTPASHPIKKNSTYAGRREGTVMIYLHNGFTVSAVTNELAADVLKNLLIPNEQVKSLRVYHGEELIESLTYTQLKARREKSKA